MQIARVGLLKVSTRHEMEQLEFQVETSSLRFKSCKEKKLCRCSLIIGEPRRRCCKQARDQQERY